MAYSKGQIITMNLDGTDRDYRILKLNGNIAEVVCMSTVGGSRFGDDDTYAGSDIDTYLNSTWYNTLTAAAKAAIVSKTFNQDSWYSAKGGSPVYSGHYGTTVPGKYPYSISKGSATYGAQITRNVYALSVQDVIDYITDTDVGDGKLENYNIWKMFWNTTTQPSISKYPWLRSADAGSTSNGWCVKDDGSVGIYNPVREQGACPAFTIDLSKIFQPQLDAPQNVTASGTVVSFDPVQNATSYAVLADGVSIGEYIPQPEPQVGTLTIHFIDDGNINGQVIINDGSPERIEGTQTKVYENVYSFEVRSYLACDITNQTGSMVGVVEQWTRYEINGDGSATIQFYD